MITSLNQLDLNKKYTYADYLTWKLEERIELIKGKIFKMAPAPSEYHQRISSNIHGEFWAFLKGKPCNVYTAPFDVRLPLPPHRQNKDGKIDTVVQPDITVVCDLTKIDTKGCIGAPELVVEVLSSGNSKREMHDKFELYEHAGVLEYWMVDPTNETIVIYKLNKEGVFIGSRPYTEQLNLTSTVLEGFTLNVGEVFM